MESESFHDMGQGANQEPKTWLLPPVGPADSKRGFLQVEHGPGSSNMGSMEEGSERRHEPRHCDPEESCIYILWRIMYLGINSYPSWYYFFYSCFVCLAFRTHSDESSVLTLWQRTLVHTVSTLPGDTSITQAREWLPNHDKQTPRAAKGGFTTFWKHGVCHVQIQGRAPQYVWCGCGVGNDGGPSPFQSSILGSETGGYHYPTLTENDITAPRETNGCRKGSGSDWHCLSQQTSGTGS